MNESVNAAPAGADDTDSAAGLQRAFPGNAAVEVVSEAAGTGVGSDEVSFPNGAPKPRMAATLDTIGAEA